MVSAVAFAAVGCRGIVCDEIGSDQASDYESKHGMDSFDYPFNISAYGPLWMNEW